MSVFDRIPTLDEGALAAIEKNAERWITTGTDKQKSEAQAVMDAIAAELLRRHDEAIAGISNIGSATDDRGTAHQGFETVWMKIVQQLHPGSTIRNWGQSSGYTGGTFQIEHVGNSTITVNGGAMAQTRSVTMGDFANVYSVYRRARMVPENGGEGLRHRVGTN